MFSLISLVVFKVNLTKSARIIVYLGLLFSHYDFFMTFKTCSPQILITVMCTDALFYAMTVILTMNGIHYQYGSIHSILIIATPLYYICLY